MQLLDLESLKGGLYSAETVLDFISKSNKVQNLTFDNNGVCNTDFSDYPKIMLDKQSSTGFKVIENPLQFYVARVVNNNTVCVQYDFKPRTFTLQQLDMFKKQKGLKLLNAKIHKQRTGIYTIEIIENANKSKGLNSTSITEVNETEDYAANAAEIFEMLRQKAKGSKSGYEIKPNDKSKQQSQTQVKPSTVYVDIQNNIDHAGIKQIEQWFQLSKLADGTYSLDGYRDDVDKRLAPSEIVLPNGIQVIKHDQFKGDMRLKKLVACETLKSIQERSFEESQILEFDSRKCKSLDIGQYAFSNSELNTAHLGEGITCLHNQAFCCCMLTSVEVVGKVRSFEPHCFGACQQLKSVRIDAPDARIHIAAFARQAIEDFQLVRIGCLSNGSLMEMHELERIKIPGTVKETPENLFVNCKKLSLIEFEDGVETIDLQMFGTTTTELSRPENKPDWAITRNGIYRDIYLPPNIKKFKTSIVEVRFGRHTSRYRLSQLQRFITHVQFGSKQYEKLVKHLKDIRGLSEQTLVDDERLYTDRELLKYKKVKLIGKSISERLLEKNNVLNSEYVGEYSQPYEDKMEMPRLSDKANEVINRANNMTMWHRQVIGLRQIDQLVSGEQHDWTDADKYMFVMLQMIRLINWQVQTLPDCTNDFSSRRSIDILKECQRDIKVLAYSRNLNIQLNLLQLQHIMAGKDQYQFIVLMQGKEIRFIGLLGVKYNILLGAQTHLNVKYIYDDVLKPKDVLTTRQYGDGGVRHKINGMDLNEDQSEMYRDIHQLARDYGTTITTKDGTKEFIYFTHSDNAWELNGDGSQIYTDSYIAQQQHMVVYAGNALNSNLYNRKFWEDKKTLKTVKDLMSGELTPEYKSQTMPIQEVAKISVIANRYFDTWQDRQTFSDMTIQDVKELMDSEVIEPVDQDDIADIIQNYCTVDKQRQFLVEQDGKLTVYDCQKALRIKRRQARQIVGMEYKANTRYDNNSGRSFKQCFVYVFKYRDKQYGLDRVIYGQSGLGPNAISRTILRLIQYSRNQTDYTNNWLYNVVKHQTFTFETTKQRSIDYRLYDRMALLGSFETRALRNVRIIVAINPANGCTYLMAVQMSGKSGITCVAPLVNIEHGLAFIEDIQKYKDESIKGIIENLCSASVEYTNYETKATALRQCIVDECDSIEDYKAALRFAQCIYSHLAVRNKTIFREP